MNKTKKILFSAGNGPNSIQIIKSFKKLDFEVLVADIDEKAPGKLFADKFFQLPRLDDHAMMPLLKEIIQKYRIDFFVPVRESECLIASRIRDEFSVLGCVLVTPNTKTIETSINKAYLYDFLAEQTDIPMMDYHVVNSLNDLKKGFKKLKHKELSIKPASGAGGRGFAIISDTPIDAKEFFTSKSQFSVFSKNQLIDMFAQSKGSVPPTILMEMLKGVHYDATMLCKDGEVLIQFVKTREESRIGTITKGEVVVNQEIEEINKKIAQVLNATGLIATQFIGNKIIEINPRWSTSLVCAQIDEYLADLKVWSGEELDFSGFDFASYLGTRMARFWDMQVYKEKEIPIIKCSVEGIIG
ncbi:MAG: ATP-grasp domain-containing protein [Methyloprofundus sp.]|nr:ATP-grasp domain-containing protein [Methyloprofundus sp.]